MTRLGFDPEIHQVTTRDDGTRLYWGEGSPRLGHRFLGHHRDGTHVELVVCRVTWDRTPPHDAYWTARQERTTRQEPTMTAEPTPDVRANTDRIEEMERQVARAESDVIRLSEELARR